MFPTAKQISKWYQQGFWTKKMVHDAVECQFITKEDYFTICGTTFEKELAK